MRYIITGGDNGYCGRCGGLGDRALLQVDDKRQTYKAYYFFEGCLGKWCWLEQKFDDGLTLVRGKKWQGDFTKMWGGNIYKMWRIKDGYVDYWLSSIYEQDGEDIKLVDSGQILTSKPIADMEEGEVLRRLFEYWEVNDPRDTDFTTYTNYIILEH